MNARDIELMQRAYERYEELMVRPEVSWVQMRMDDSGVVLTVGVFHGDQREETISPEE